MAELRVALRGVFAGTVTRSRDGVVSFAYDGGYRDIPLSPSLPIRDAISGGAHGHQAVANFLAGLLPDNPAVRARWAAEFKIPDEPFLLLSHMGLECAGAVQFVKPGDEDLLGSGGSYEPVAREGIGVRLRELRQAAEEDRWTHVDEHWSLAGAQAKFTLASIDGNWYEAMGSAATTHIVKPGIRKMRDQALVEFATMRAARRCGLRTAQVEMEDFDGEPALVIRRFDRVLRDGRVIRLHQVDLCQASGYSPSQKYEERGGPSARRLADLIRSVSTRPADDLRDFSDALLFNYLCLAPDGHSKNMALLFAGRQARFAPLYDLATGAPYGTAAVAPRAAFAVGGVRNFGEAYPKHWRAHALEFSLDPDERTERVRMLAGAIPDAFRDVAHHDIGGDAGARLWLRMSAKQPDGAGRLLDYCSRVERRLAGS